MKLLIKAPLAAAGERLSPGGGQWLDASEPSAFVPALSEATSCVRHAVRGGRRVRARRWRAVRAAARVLRRAEWRSQGRCVRRGIHPISRAGTGAERACDSGAFGWMPKGEVDTPKRARAAAYESCCAAAPLKRARSRLFDRSRTARHRAPRRYRLLREWPDSDSSSRGNATAVSLRVRWRTGPCWLSSGTG